MKTSILRTAAFTLALATGAVGLSAAASADDSINRINDSMVQQRQMDYLSRHGGYVLIQDQNALAVGGRNATMIEPAPRYYAVTPSYVVAPSYVVGAPVASGTTTYVVPSYAPY